VNASDANTTVARRTASYVGGRPRVIRLAINSKELMVAGRFDHWVPVAMEGNGAEGAAQLFFDVTGMARRADDEELFSFESTEVKRVGDLAFVARGTLRQGETERVVDAVVQTPMAHTPFLAITFPLDQAAFPEIWGDLAALVAGGRNDGALQITPRAWLRVPALAAA
jgi:hypothetical protein